MPVFLSGLSTALPQNQYRQEDILQYMQKEAPDNLLLKRSLTSIYHNSGIQFRYSVLPDFKEGTSRFFVEDVPPSTQRRMHLYATHAFELGKAVVAQVEEKMASVSVDFQKITHLVWVSCTGMVAPGIETLLAQAFSFRQPLQTTAFNFLGCHGFFHALRFARAAVQADSNAKVLIVCAELCTLHFQPKWHTDQLLANAIFGDGAAGLVVSNEGFGENTIEITHQSQSHFPDSADAMTWNVGDTGFNMRLAQELPDHLERVVSQAIDRTMETRKEGDSPIRHWIFHPGGKRILDRLQIALDLQAPDLMASRKALEMVGNVSSASVLFALKAFFSKTPKSEPQTGLMLGVGPGLVLETALFRF